MYVAYLRKECLKVNMVSNSIEVMCLTRKKKNYKCSFLFFNYKFPYVICKLKFVSSFNLDLNYLLTYLQF